jgi:hypothetical protein
MIWWSGHSLACRSTITVLALASRYLPRLCYTYWLGLYTHFGGKKGIGTDLTVSFRGFGIFRGSEPVPLFRLAPFFLLALLWKESGRCER